MNVFVCDSVLDSQSHSYCMSGICMRTTQSTRSHYRSFKTSISNSGSCAFVIYVYSDFFYFFGPHFHTPERARFCYATATFYNCD